MKLSSDIQYEVQEKIGNRWLAISHPESAGRADIIYDQSCEENPDSEFRIVRIETKRTVVQIGENNV